MVTAVVILSLAPISALPQMTSNYSDKFGHALMYSALMGWFALINRRPEWVRIGALVFALGAALEICQGFLPYRTASFADAVANALGVMLGASAAFAVESLFPGGSRA